MNTKLIFAMSHQGETDYKVYGGDFDGRTIRVLYATRAYYLGLVRFMRTPLERNMMEQTAALAGTVSFVGGDEVPAELIDIARSRQGNAIRLCPDVAAPDLKPAMLDSKGTWVISEPKPVPTKEVLTSSMSPHPMFVAARQAAAQRRVSMGA